jgi:hypothetical protein
MKDCHNFTTCPVLNCRAVHMAFTEYRILLDMLFLIVFHIFIMSAFHWWFTFICHSTTGVWQVWSSNVLIMVYLAVPWLRRLVAGLSPWRPEFTPRSIHVGFVVDKVALGQVFLRVLQFSHQYHSTVTLQLPRYGGWTICLLVAAIQRCSLTPSKSINQSINGLYVYLMMLL